MAKSTASARKRKAATKTKPNWDKPYPEYPLSYHPPSGRLYKKIRGKRFYFGYADDWQAALDKYVEERDDLYAGRTPRQQAEGLTIRGLCNQYLAHQKIQFTKKEITGRHWHDCKRTCDRLIRVFTANRLVDDLRAEDFTKLSLDIAVKRGPKAQTSEITRVKSVFNYAYESDLIDRPAKFGPGFKQPKKRALRKEQNERGKKFFEADELKKLLAAAGPQMHAMILLGVNCGFNNSDCGQLPKAVVDLQAGWIEYPRSKTAIERRCPLWPETVEAIRQWESIRPAPKEDSARGKMFVTKYGHSWFKTSDLDRENSSGPLSAEFRKLQQDCGIHRKYRGFSSLRHVFQTVGENVSETATRYIMGHTDNSMSANYREEMRDERLTAVTDYVRAWLFGEEQEEPGEKEDPSEDQ